MKKETGGPAFPIVLNGNDNDFVYGMTLRDYFAAKAMQGLIASTSPEGRFKLGSKYCRYFL